MNSALVVSLIIALCAPLVVSQCTTISNIQDNFRYTGFDSNTTQPPMEPFYSQMYIMPNTSTYNAAGVGLLAGNVNLFPKSQNNSLRFAVYSGFPNATFIASSDVITVTPATVPKFIVGNVFFLPFSRNYIDTFQVVKTEIEWYIGIWATQPIQYMKGYVTTSYQSSSKIDLTNQNWPMKMNWTDTTQNSGQTYTSVIGCMTQRKPNIAIKAN